MWSVIGYHELWRRPIFFFLRDFFLTLTETYLQNRPINKYKSLIPKPSPSIGVIDCLLRFAFPHRTSTSGVVWLHLFTALVSKSSSLGKIGILYIPTELTRGFIEVVGRVRPKKARRVTGKQAAGLR